MNAIGIFSALIAASLSFGAYATQLPPPVGYTSAQLINEDQFTSPTLDSTKWNPWLGQNGSRWCDYVGSCLLPAPYSGETLNSSPYNAEYYDPYPYGAGTSTTGNHLVGGNGLQLIASRSSYFGSLSYSWASAIISSTGKSMIVPATGGYVQISAKMPDMTQGAWPLFWFLSEHGAGSAIDFEFGYNNGGANPNYMYQVTWCCDTASGTPVAAVDLSQAYHTYGMEYRPASSSSTYDGTVKFFCDGQLVASYASNQTGAYQILLVLQMAQNSAGWHSSFSSTTTGPYTLAINDVQIYSLTAPTDTTAPSVPTGLMTSLVAPVEVDLSWTPSTDDVGVAGYKIRRNGRQIATSTTSSYADKTVVPITTYSYHIQAYDAAGNISGSSTALSVTTPGFGLGAPVTTLSIINVMSLVRGRGVTLCTQTASINGTILNGPQNVKGVPWWYVGFVSGCSGWVQQTNLGLN